ncbi:MAG: MFS transporter [Microbacterium sp.]
MTTSTSLSRGAAMRALLSLSVGGFGIGMTEFVSMGLLPGIAQSLLPAQYAASPEAAIAQAGILISVYAVGVVLGAPTITAFVSRFPLKRVLVVLVLALLVGNALTVVAPTFALAVVSRLLAGLPHGAFFGIAAVVASDLLGEGRRGRAISIVMSGLTVANLVGVPLGTLLGQHLGWRASYLVVTLVFALAAGLIALAVPARPGEPARSVLTEMRIFRLPQVWLTIAIGAIGFGAFFAVFSYVATLVTEVSGAAEWVVPLALVSIGCGMTIGNLLGGVLADISVRRTLIWGLVASGASCVLVGVCAHETWALVGALFVFAVCTSAATPTVQLRLLDVAPRFPAIAAALNHSALNIGNSLGAALGGIVIAAGWGYIAPVWVGAVLAVIGVVIALAAFGAARTTPLRGERPRTR